MVMAAAGAESLARTGEAVAGGAKDWVKTGRGMMPRGTAAGICWSSGRGMAIVWAVRRARGARMAEKVVESCIFGEVVSSVIGVRGGYS